jgi:hypothetical protein
VAQAELGDAAVGLVTTGGITQQDPHRHARRQRLAELSERDRGLGFEGDRRRHPRLGPAGRIIRPDLGQKELVGDRQAGMIVGHREADRHLTVVRLAQLPAVLPRHTHRVLALLGKAAVVDDPVRHRSMPLDRRQHLRPHRRQQHRIVPVRLRHHVVQRLVFGLHMRRVEPCRHRLDALALAGQQQAGAAGPRRGGPPHMSQPPGDRIQIRRQSGLARQRLSRSFLIHRPYRGSLQATARGK